MNDVIAVARCRWTLRNGIGNGIVHGPGPFDNYIEAPCVSVVDPILQEQD
jgi:hypothetical protein